MYLMSWAAMLSVTGSFPLVLSNHQKTPRTGVPVYSEIWHPFPAAPHRPAANLIACFPGLDRRVSVPRMYIFWCIIACLRLREPQVDH
jgi:hypothetical protein